MANGVVILNIGITVEIFKLLGKVPDENDKLVIDNIGLLNADWKNFSNLLGMLEGSVDLLFFSSFITDNTLSLLVGDIKKELTFGFFRYSEYLCFGFVKFCSICLAMEVKILEMIVLVSNLFWIPAAVLLHRL